MSNLQDVANQQTAMHTIVSLTGVFEGLASMRISQTKNQVLQSQYFFDDLWHIYSQLRVDNLFRFGRDEDEQPIDKQLFIVITSEGSFSGDIDQRLIKLVLQDHDPAKQDIVVIGHHGAILLAQANTKFVKYFTLPKKDTNINVTPLLREVRHYKSTVVYYQTYVSLMFQDLKRIELNAAVAAQGKQAKAGKDEISELTYIFEPSTFDVVAHLERSMTQIALSQVILDSKLAQYASRFRAMTAANDRAEELVRDLDMSYHRTKRHIQDERLKEIINGLRKVRVT
jgi:F-type H+-transporting ATPase subunit gamma